MNIIKRTLCVLIVAVLLFTAAPVMNADVLEFKVGANTNEDFEYSIADDKVTLTAYKD